MRFRIQKELEDLCNKGELYCVDFHLVRHGSNKCVSNDDIRIYKLVEIEDAVLNMYNWRMGVSTHSDITCAQAA